MPEESFLNKDHSLCLKKGDIVELVAPASGCSEEEYNSCLKFIENLGLKASCRSYSELIDNKELFFSNSAEYRFEHLYNALLDCESRAVWCINGGYGSYQLLERLSGVSVPKSEKLFIGFSDITVLSNYFIDKWNWRTIYGITLGQIIRKQVSDDAVSQLKDLIFNPQNSISLDLVPINKTAKANGSKEGKFVGGCLSLMQVLLGTEHNINTKGKVLLLEDDCFETPQRISRIFDHMKRAKFFDGVQAVILGSFLEGDINKPASKEALYKVCGDLGSDLDELNIPLLTGENIGHSKNMLSVPLGANASLKLGDNSNLCLEGI